MANSTDARSLKNITKPCRYSIPGSKGLHLWVKKDGKKYWIFRYTFAEQRFDFSLGTYPEIHLSEAREKSIKLRAKIINGINPRDERVLIKQAKVKENSKPQINFEKFSLDYIERMSPRWRSIKHESQWVSCLRIYAFPSIGKLALSEITTQNILNILNPIWTSKQVTAIRLRGRLERIISASITNGLRAEKNPASWKGHLENILPWMKPSGKHYAAMDYKDLPALMKQLAMKEHVSSLALQFTILNALRTSEGLYAKKSEIKDGIFTIPANRMKGNIEHQVPLAPYSLKIVEKASSYDSSTDLIFHNKGSKLSNMSMLMLIRGLHPGMTVHGFRSSFRDWVSEETNYSSEVAEMTLAHKIVSKVEAAYRRGKLLERRKQLLIDWANFCCSRLETSESHVQ
jgi:integrase